MCPFINCQKLFEKSNNLKTHFRIHVKFYLSNTLILLDKRKTFHV
jgi:hypothetical protein